MLFVWLSLVNRVVWPLLIRLVLFLVGLTLSIGIVTFVIVVLADLLKRCFYG